jgi:hypothetical protein
MFIIFLKDFIKFDSLIKSNYFQYCFLFLYYDFKVELFLIIDQIFVSFVLMNLNKFILSFFMLMLIYL